jgi:hypothetical protein
VNELRTIIGDQAFTNVLLATNIVLVARLFPLARQLLANTSALCEHFALTITARHRRPRTEPGE